MTLVMIDNDAAQVMRRVPRGEARREATLRDLIAKHHEQPPSIGTQVRAVGAEAIAAFDELLAERDDVDAEFAAAGLDVPEWNAGEIPTISLRRSFTTPWSDADDDEQRDWLARAGNQFVNSLRLRLQRLERDLAA